MKSSLALLLTFIFAAATSAQYEIARPGYHYEFPRDHFSHPAYETEWWYYTGNLRSPDGHRFGFELTFFRQGVSRDANPSDWYVHDLYMAHLALSDLSGHRYYHEERINRAGPGIAGISASTGLIWNGNWQVRIADGRHTLQGIAPDFQIHLQMTSAKPPVIQGQNGISQKAAGAGHASHYISLTRLLTTGTVQVSGATYNVEGASWMDHEFFTGSMAPGETGWDWVGLQFDNNTELMLYRLRHRDGSIDPYSSGSYVDPQGHATFLSSRDFTMTPAGQHWTSPQTGGSYPIRWHIAIPSLHLELDLSTPLPEQEMTSRFGPSYWEGAVDVTARQSGAAIHGDGYLEMTGYGAAEANRNFP